MIGQGAFRRRQDGAEFLTDIDGVTDLRLPFTHRAFERRLDRINGFVGFDFAERVVEVYRVARVFEKRDDQQRNSKEEFPLETYELPI